MNFSLTLNRWHKVAERIGTAVKERESRVKNALTLTTISPWNKHGIVEKSAAIAVRASEDLALVEIGTAAVARIRAALAIRNAQLGISGKLAEAEAATRRAALYRNVIEGQSTDMVRPEAVHALPDLAGEAEGFGRRWGGTVVIQTAEPALIDAFRKRHAEETERATRLLDEVADLNREKLEIEVPRDVLGIAGLAA